MSKNVRSTILTLVQSFHGRTITTLKATGQDKFHQFFYPFTEGFNYVKANKWKPVYVFQLDEEDDYGNISWKNFSIIKDLSKEEFEEMKKYANFISYTNARIEGKTRNIKYSMSLLNK